MIFDVWNLEVGDSVVTAKLIYKSDTQSVKYLFRPPEAAYTLKFHLTVRTSRLGLDLECEAKAVIIENSYIESMTLADVRRELSQVAYSGNTDHVLLAFEAYLNLALEEKLEQPVKEPERAIFSEEVLYYQQLLATAQLMLAQGFPLSEVKAKLQERN